MAAVDKIIKSVSDSGTARLVSLAFMIGMAWARFEYKSDRDMDRVITALEKHVITDTKEKEIIQMKIDNIKKDIADNNELLRAHISEFIRSEETTYKSRKKWN